MSDVTTSDVTTSGLTRRTWIALGLAEALFAVAYPAGVLLALKVPAADASDGWADLAYFATFLVAGAFFVVVGLPVAVHTVGRLTERYTYEWPRWWASVAHLGVGMMVGALAASLVLAVQNIAVAALALAFVMPAGLAALGTHLLMPLTMRHAWIRIASWVLAAVPVGLTLVFVASIGVRNL